MKKIFLIAIVFIFILAYYSCEIDHGLEPLRSAVQGTITYSGAWPGIPAEVRLIAAKSFPPSDITDLIIGENLPTDVESIDYSFYLNPGTYKLVGVAWREQGGTWDIVSICGLYFAGTDSLVPGEIVLATDTSIVKNVDMQINRSKARRVTKSRIVGKINFAGTWPDSVIDVRVIAAARPFSIFPVMKFPTLLDLSFSNSIPVNVSSASYSINAFPSKYYATGVVFFKANQSLSSNDIMYSLSKGGINFSEYEVLEDSVFSGPEFNIQF